MPIERVSHCDAGRRYEQKTANFIPPTKYQNQLDRIAASVERNGPGRCNAVSMLYLSAFVLPNILCIRSSPLTTSHCREERALSHNASLHAPNATFPIATSSVSSAESRTTVLRDPSLQTRPSTPTSHASLPQPYESFPTPPRVDTKGWLRFPMAAAAPPPPTLEYLERDEQNNLLVAYGDAGKRMLLSLAKSFMSDLEHVNHQQLQEREFEWTQSTASGPISISRIDINAPYFRTKRIPFSEHDRRIREHITEHCAHEAQIYNSEGLSEGKMLIFIAQRIENPFRMLYDDIDGYEPPKAVEYASQGINFLVNVMTLGLKPLISNLLANELRRRYFAGIDDPICASRQNHISYAQIVTSLDVSGLKFKSARRTTISMPTELQNIRGLMQEHTTYFSHDKHRNIRTNLSLLVKNKNPKKSQSELALKAKEGNEFETYYPDPSDPSGQKKRVIFDEKNNIWHFDDMTDKASLNIRIKHGETFIALHGKHFPIREESDGKHYIITQNLRGVKKNLPVYTEPLSKTWHLETENGHPVFTVSQKGVIEQIRIEIQEHFQYAEINNLHPQLYGTGKLYEVRNLQDDILATPPLYTVIEMNGALVPIKSLTNKNAGAHYYAYDINAPSRLELRVEWTGNRWILEKSTSPHVSLALAQRITAKMYATDVNENLLSAADEQGIKWIDGRGFLNIKSQYVEIHKGAVTQIGSTEGNKMIVYYANQQFYPLLPGSQILIWRRQLADHFYEILKDTSKQHLQEGYSFISIEKAAKVTFVSARSSALAPALPKEPVSINVEVVSSSDIDRKRYLVTLSDTDYFFVEISHDGKQVWVLKDEESDLAMEKHQRNLAGGLISSAIALKRTIEPILFRAQSRAQIDTLAFQRIESGAQEFRAELKRLTEGDDAMDNILLVGHADFMLTSAFENNVFSTTDNVYQALIDAFIPISKANPYAIIIPGSVYVSHDIPEKMRQSQLSYQQGDMHRPLYNAVNFASVLVPVFHKGKIITIARKGEYLTYTPPNAAPDSSPVEITNLDDNIPFASTIHVVNAKTSPYATSNEWNEAHTGTIYAGKTLLPSERTRADWFFCPCRDKKGNEVDVNRFFSNEFIANDEKFLIVIEDEFIQNGVTRPTVRTLAFPQNETTDDINRYDWIIHLGTHEMDNAMLSASYNYIQADRNSNSQYYSNVSQRVLSKTYLEKQRLLVFKFDSD